MNKQESAKAKAEEYLNENFIAEYYEGSVYGEFAYKFNDVVKAMESYHQSRVNAISYDEIENIIITAIVKKTPIGAVKRIKQLLKQ